MADDLDGVNLSSAVRQYNPGDQYRVKETDPDEAGGGRDFYDGFMRKKKPPPEEEEKKDGAKPSEDKTPDEQLNPIPVVEQFIQDDVVLSARAQQLMGRLDESQPQTEKTPPPADRKPPEPPPPGHIKVQA